jgi:hypothetical protein
LLNQLWCTLSVRNENIREMYSSNYMPATMLANDLKFQMKRSKNSKSVNGVWVKKESKLDFGL